MITSRRAKNTNPTMMVPRMVSSGFFIFTGQPPHVSVLWPCTGVASRFGTPPGRVNVATSAAAQGYDHRLGRFFEAIMKNSMEMERAVLARENKKACRAHFGWSGGAGVFWVTVAVVAAMIFF